MVTLEYYPDNTVYSHGPFLGSWFKIFSLSLVLSNLWCALVQFSLCFSCLMFIEFLGSILFYFQQSFQPLYFQNFLCFFSPLGTSTTQILDPSMIYPELTVVLFLPFLKFFFSLCVTLGWYVLLCLQVYLFFLLQHLICYFYPVFLSHTL